MNKHLHARSHSLVSLACGSGWSRALQAALFALLPIAVQAQSAVSTVRATEIKADKVPGAATVASLPAGAEVQAAEPEGGWVRVVRGKDSGWVRASSLSLHAAASAASAMPSGRQASGNTAVTLGVRSLQPRVNRHALIIGVGRYADAAVPPLPGVVHDKVSATQMAHAMQVPNANIRYLHDEQATGANIRKALRELNDRVQEGDRVFIHYSGHGTRYNDTAAGGCIEALLAYDGGAEGTITNREMSQLLQPITNKTDKLFVLYDACHSGGLVAATPTVRSRGLFNANDEGALRPKFSNISDECGRPVNVKTRNLAVEQVDRGALPQDIVHISAARHNEMSFDDEQKGGLATSFMRDCMLRDAKDLDGSGALSIDEIRQCAQQKINQRMQNDVNFRPHSIVLSGNSQFVPTWFSRPVDVQSISPGGAALPSGPLPPSGLVPVQPVAVPPITGAQALQQMYEQRDAKRKIHVDATRSTLKIKQDLFDFQVESDRPGYVYVVLAGSDNQSVYTIFPNALDGDNRIEPGRPMRLPRENWQLRSQGPVGNNTLLVMVADGPRDLASRINDPSQRAGPFVKSLNSVAGRAELGSLLSTSSTESDPVCRGAQRKQHAHCSDAYGAVILSIQEVE